MSYSNYRIGLGFDVHRLVAGRPCILGGIELPHETGPDGHSDGDAVLHAVADAVLGAAGLDDLGLVADGTDHPGRDVAGEPVEQGLVVGQAVDAKVL